MFEKQKKNKIEKVVGSMISNLPDYNCYINECEKYNQKFNSKVEYYDESIYVKLYYIGEINQKVLDTVYVYSSKALKKINYTFNGLTLYRENREICLTFLKDN